MLSRKGVGGDLFRAVARHNNHAVSIRHDDVAGPHEHDRL
jgi:hypothetical protein